MVVQRFLPLQPGIQQPYNVLTPTDVNYNSSTTPHESPIIKANDFNSTLTTKNVNLMNSLTETSCASTSTDKNANREWPQTPTDISRLLKLDDEGIDIECAKVMDSTTIDNAQNEQQHLIEEDDDANESDEEENNRMRQKINEDPGIQSLMEISLPSPIPIASPDECKPFLSKNIKRKQNLSILFPTDFSDGSQPPISPIRILRESPVPADAKWFEENMNDFSLSSFLGQLDSTIEQANNKRSPNRCVSLKFIAFFSF